jgi:putative membrane protein
VRPSSFKERNHEPTNALSILAITVTMPSVAFAKGQESVDERHAEETLAIGSVALKTSQLAQTKAQDKWVKKFANYEVAEQTTIAEILKSMGAAPPKADKAEAMVDKLEKSSKFDADYITGQLDGHQELLKVQDEYISSGKNMANVNLAKLARAQIKEHIDLLQTIQQSLKS